MVAHFVNPDSSGLEEAPALGSGALAEANYNVVRLFSIVTRFPRGNRDVVGILRGLPGLIPQATLRLTDERLLSRPITQAT